MQVKGERAVPVTTVLAVVTLFGPYSKNQIDRVPDILIIENNSHVSSQSSYLGWSTSLATAVTVHFDADELGTGTFTNDVIAPVTIQAGGEAMVNILVGAPIDKPIGGQLQLRAIAASFATTLRVTELNRYTGVQ
jgi:putative Mn2+ efflux pump MntP